MCLIVFLSELIKLCQVVRHGRLLKANFVPTKGLCRLCCLDTPGPGYLSGHQQGLHLCRELSGSVIAQRSWWYSEFPSSSWVYIIIISYALGNKEKDVFSFFFFFSFLLCFLLKFLFFPFSLVLLYWTCHCFSILWMLFQDWLIHFFCLLMYAVYKFNMHPIKIP